MLQFLTFVWALLLFIAILCSLLFPDLTGFLQVETPGVLGNQAAAVDAPADLKNNYELIDESKVQTV